MVALADRLGASSLATGHYARLADDGAGPLLTAAADPAKDQTYMLSGLRPATLARLRFPLGELTKPEVARAGGRGRPRGRVQAREPGPLLPRGRGQALVPRAPRRARGPRRARSSTARARSLGEHPGHHHFTVGQRRGLGVATGEPLYVLGTDAAANRVVVGQREELARTTVRLRGRAASPRLGAGRSRQASLPLARDPCRVSRRRPGEHAELELELAEPAYGVAPGQTACLLDGDLVVGRATIAAATGRLT